MIACTFEITEDIDDLYKIFSAEKLASKRAECAISKGDALKISVRAKDPVSLKAFTNSILKIIQTYYNIKSVK